MLTIVPAPVNEQSSRQTIAEKVFCSLEMRIRFLDLEPGSRLSEFEVAHQLDVSRQPVRDAFYRLAKLGFLIIRPQRPTMVSLISETAVLQARYIRKAVEAAVMQTACKVLSSTDFDALDKILDEQRAADHDKDIVRFYTLDDQFHQGICERSGAGFAWTLINENKVHMDRVRMMSLTAGSQEAIEDHEAILDAIKDRDADQATNMMQVHLSRIRSQLDQIKQERRAWFEDCPPK